MEIGGLHFVHQTRALKISLHVFHIIYATEIWMVGSSLVYWAQRRATTKQAIGTDLGLGFRVLWKGQRGMKWDSLVPLLRHKLTRNPPPAWLLIHLGSNDITDQQIGQLIKTLDADFAQIRSLFPNTQVIWSDILQRISWRGFEHDPVTERKRQRFNRHGRRTVLNMGGRAICHGEISVKDRGLFRPDGVHLSDIGNDIFLNDLQGGVETFIKDSRCRVFQN